MIWNEYHNSPRPDLEALAGHISSEIGPSPAASPAQDAEVALSIAEFMLGSRALAPAVRKGAKRKSAAGGTLIPSDFLLVMTCRALWSIGQEAFARQLLQEKVTGDISASCMHTVFSKGLFPRLAVHAALARALKPSSACWSMSGQCWILNLRTLFSFLNPGLELAIWRTLRALIKEIAVLWDASGGQGALGITNAGYISGRILNLPANSSQSRKFSAELMHYCAQALQIASAERQWRLAPTVVAYDY